MRKRRRLANKMTIMLCAVLIAVSAFFYAPMEVSAEEVEYFDTYHIDLDYEKFGLNFSTINNYFDSFDISSKIDDFDAGAYYELTFDVDYQCEYSVPLNVRIHRLFLGDYVLLQGSDSDNVSSVSDSSQKTFVFKGSELVNPLSVNLTGYIFLRNQYLKCIVDGSVSIDIVSYSEVTVTDYEAYQNGYNAGYSAGEEAGESNGYSNGYSDGYEAGEQSGYDSGFQAGSDSVDTQSYYDAGYSAGYDAGYFEGYETGYDEGYDSGWSAYEAQMDKWGADTTVYPILISSGSRSRVAFEHLLGEDYCFPFDYHCFSNWYGLDNFNVDANHTYKFEFWYDSISEYDDDWVEYSDLQLFANIGGFKYPLILLKSGEDKKISIYISGDRMSDSMSFEAVFYGVCNLKADSHVGLIQLVINNLNVAYYDMGPSGDTQNHIANQTDQLTNGYDDSKGNTVNSNLSTGLNDYETAENSLFATATTGMRDFTFFDFESVPAMITGMSFIGSIMGSWFNQAGGASGVGIVLSILFSVILVAMVLGLYRWYQSRGGKD